MAKALVDYAQLYSIEPHPAAVVEFHNFPGEGIHGKLDSQEIYIGNRRIAQRAHSETGKTFGLVQYFLAAVSFSFILIIWAVEL